MRVITYKSQCTAFKSLSNIICYLATVEDDEAVDAICEVYKITRIIGGEEMLKHMRGGTRVKTTTTSAMRTWSKEEMLEYIKLLEDSVERYQEMGR